jgi:hypothetical protein
MAGTPFTVSSRISFISRSSVPSGLAFRLLRSCLSVVLAILQPSPRRPTTLDCGTRTSEKKTWVKEFSPRSPDIVRSGCTSMPGVSIRSRM